MRREKLLNGVSVLEAALVHAKDFVRLLLGHEATFDAEASLRDLLSGLVDMPLGLHGVLLLQISEELLPVGVHGLWTVIRISRCGLGSSAGSEGWGKLILCV